MEWDVIHSYSRAQALEDGALIDVSATALEAGFNMPVALTAAAWAECVALTEVAREMGCDEAGRLWDVLYMLHFAIKEMGTGSRVVLLDADGDASTLTYALHVVRNRPDAQLVKLKSVCGPDDDGKPCITVMLPEED